jgi:hypothetical protein
MNEKNGEYGYKRQRRDRSNGGHEQEANYIKEAMEGKGLQ